jgi:hypothetical protein
MTQIAMREFPDSNLGRQIRDPERLCDIPQIRQARAVIVLSLDHDRLLPNHVKPITLPLTLCCGVVVASLAELQTYITLFSALSLPHNILISFPCQRLLCVLCYPTPHVLLHLVLLSLMFEVVLFLLYHDKIKN